MPDTGKGTHVSSRQEAAVIMAYLRSKSSAKRVKASVGSKTRSSGRGANHLTAIKGENIMSIMIDPTMNIPMEELELIIAGISDDGTISKEAEKALLARIEEGKAKDYINPMGEVKRQLRCKIGPVEGKKIADAIDKLW